MLCIVVFCWCVFKCVSVSVIAGVKESVCLHSSCHVHVLHRQSSCQTAISRIIGGFVLGPNPQKQLFEERRGAMSNMPSLSRGGESRGQGLGRGRKDEVDGSIAHLSTLSFCYAAAHFLPARQTSLPWKNQRNQNLLARTCSGTNKKLGRRGQAHQFDEVLILDRLHPGARTASCLIPILNSLGPPSPSRGRAPWFCRG